MSVSVMIDSFTMRRPKKSGRCPQREIPAVGFMGTNVDVENTYTGEYAQVPVMPNFNAVNRVRKPQISSLLPPPCDYVPLKSDQMNTRPPGAVLFDAPINPPHAKLKTPTNEGRVINNLNFMTEHFPSIPPDIMYKSGIRPFPSRPIKFDEVYEPRGMVYKIAGSGLDRSNEVAVSQRGDGTDELRAMMGR